MADPLSAADLQDAFERLVEALHRLGTAHPIALLGIANGGIPIARMLAEALDGEVPCGTLNALFYRDDVGRQPIPADFQSTSFDFPVDDAHIVLVDDVFATGRTIRAALNELFDHGRPASVHLAVLIDAKRPILPIQPDFVGLHFPCPGGQLIKVHLDPADPTAHTAVLRRHT